MGATEDGASEQRKSGGRGEERRRRAKEKRRQGLPKAPNFEQKTLRYAPRLGVAGLSSICTFQSSVLYFPDSTSCRFNYVRYSTTITGSSWSPGPSLYSERIVHQPHYCAASPMYLSKRYTDAVSHISARRLHQIRDNWTCQPSVSLDTPHE